jgi:hypothetical protein
MKGKSRVLVNECGFSFSIIEFLKLISFGVTAASTEEFSWWRG